MVVSRRGVDYGDNGSRPAHLAHDHLVDTGSFAAVSRAGLDHQNFSHASQRRHSVGHYARPPSVVVTDNGDRNQESMVQDSGAVETRGEAGSPSFCWCWRNDSCPS